MKTIPRDENRRRTRGLCWSCCSYAPVRPRTFYTTGIRQLLCCKCERQFVLNTGTPSPERQQLRLLAATF